jgi:hypothetical protein
MLFQSFPPFCCSEGVKYEWDKTLLWDGVDIYKAVLYVKRVIFVGLLMGQSVMARFREIGGRR